MRGDKEVGDGELRGASITIDPSPPTQLVEVSPDLYAISLVGRRMPQERLKMLDGDLSLRQIQQ